MVWIYRLQFPTKTLALVAPHLHAPQSVLEFATLRTPECDLLPSVWAYGPDRARLADRFEDARAITACSKTAHCPDRVRYHLDWNTDAAGVSALGRLATTLADNDVTLLYGRITPSEWLCLLQVPSQTAVVQFYAECDIAACRLDQHADRELRSFWSKSQ